MARSVKFVEFLIKNFPGLYDFAKLTRIPIIGKIIDLLLFNGDYLIYLPKDKVINVNRTLNGPDEFTLPSQVLISFINKTNYHWIMNFCICRTGMKCKDYPLELGCLFLGEAVLGINPKFGRRVSKNEALEHVKRCSEVGLVHVVGRNLLDKQWLGVKPGNKLLTICNCCPCCCLWRIAPVVNPKIGKRVKRMPGITVQVTNKCTGCGICTKGTCFVDAIQLIGKEAKISNECRGCGRCIDVCPQKAIELIIEGKYNVQKVITRIEKLVDVT